MVSNPRRLWAAQLPRHQLPAQQQHRRRRRRQPGLLLRGPRPHPHRLHHLSGRRPGVSGQHLELLRAIRPRRRRRHQHRDQERHQPISRRTVLLRPRQRPGRRQSIRTPCSPSPTGRGLHQRSLPSRTTGASSGASASAGRSCATSSSSSTPTIRSGETFPASRSADGPERSLRSGEYNAACGRDLLHHRLHRLSLTLSAEGDYNACLIAALYGVPFQAGSAYYTAGTGHPPVLYRLCSPYPGPGDQPAQAGLPDQRPQPPVADVQPHALLLAQWPLLASIGQPGPLRLGQRQCQGGLRDCPPDHGAQRCEGQRGDRAIRSRL